MRQEFSLRVHNVKATQPMQDDSLVQAGVFAFLLLSTTGFLGAGYFLLVKPLLSRWIFQ